MNNEIETALKFLEKKRENDRKAQANRRAKLKAEGKVLKQVWVREHDPNQTEIAQPEDSRISEMRTAIDLFRTKNKGTVSLAKQKDLVFLIQQLEEILE